MRLIKYTIFALCFVGFLYAVANSILMTGFIGR